MRPDDSDSLSRVRFAVRMGLVARDAGNASLAQSQLESANRSIELMTQHSSGRALAELHLEHAAVLFELGQADKAKDALDQALTLAPDDTGVASHAVTYFITHARWREAFTVANAFRSRTQLDVAERVYFHLWAYQAARIAGLDAAQSVLESLQRLTRNNPSTIWSMRLAQRWAGQLPAEQLMTSARTPRQRGEAHFYEALDALARKSQSDASRELTEVIATKMLHDVEYQMAAGLLALNRPSTGLQATRTP